MPKTHLVGATLLDGDSPPRLDTTVVFENERIVAVDESVPVGPEDKVIDLAGRTLMPGMVAGHYHAGYHDIGVARGFPAIERPPIYAALRGLNSLQKALRAGFTSVVGAGAPYDMDAQLDAAIRDGVVQGPRMVPSSRDFYSSADTTFFIPWWIQAPAGVGLTRNCSGPEDFRRGVRIETDRGARMIKVFVTGGHGSHEPKSVEFVTRKELEAIVDAAHERGARVRTHITTKARILHAVECGVDVLDHADGIDEECIEAIARAGTTMLPSLMYPALMTEAMKAAPDGKVDFFSDEDLADFRHMCLMLPLAVKAGVRLCIGDDYGAPVMPHGTYGRELAVYAEHAGIKPLEVIRWATCNGGILMGREDLGLIRRGMLADMIVVHGDPLKNLHLFDDISNIRFVIKGGVVVHDSLGSVAVPVRAVA